MGFYLLVTCILSAVIAQGYALSCVQCISTDGNSCTGPVMPCPVGDYVCSSTYTETMMKSQPTEKQFIRQCELKAACGSSGSITMPGGKVKSNSTCCRTDGCDPGLITFPPTKSSKNGVVCDSCIVVGTDTCPTVEPMECTGDESRCVTQVTSVSVASISTKTVIRGCSTPSICEAGTVEADQEGMKMTTTVHCSKNNAVGLHYSQLLLALSGLFLLKLVS
ncbi:hypothetical protein GDO86_012171 [Hymenochirus boettgeri]|uniref:UPAR/Ly6 domain-containing protein n=1 Tax=Hymenochirus boettgeri TaxID=247094 RepID=A0A8T2IP10_9PIPI|nr:hypothetical protein GDO86_012171 [Hymenochirus boettgeri]